MHTNLILDIRCTHQLKLLNVSYGWWARRIHICPAIPTFTVLWHNTAAVTNSAVAATSSSVLYIGKELAAS